MCIASDCCCQSPVSTCAIKSVMVLLPWSASQASPARCSAITGLTSFEMFFCNGSAPWSGTARTMTAGSRREGFISE